MNKKYVIGVDLGGTKIYTALVDLKGNIVKEMKIPTESEKGEKVVLDKIIDTIDFVIDGVNKDEIKAIGLGSPGPLDVKKGMIAYTPNLPFRNFDIVTPIKDKYSIDTYLDNDANVATLGEYMFGAGKGTENMVFITVSTGVGGGAVLNGKIYRGSTANALEIGHMTVKKDGPRCGCGNRGCAEAMASGTAIGKRGREAVETKVNTSLSNYEVITAKEVFDEATKGDLVAKEIIDEALTYLGIAVANILNAFDPDKVVIGGGVSEAGPIVFEKIDEEVNKRALKIIGENTKIEKAELGGKAGLLGAAALAIIEAGC